MEKIIDGYEKVLKLNVQEMKNQDEIIKMYESIVELSTSEIKDARETLAANSAVSSLSRNELIDAFAKIRELEEANKKLREQAERIQ